MQGQEVLEIRPRSGRWYPGFIGLPTKGPLKVMQIMHGPSGHPTLSGMIRQSKVESGDGQWTCDIAHHAIDALTALYVTFDAPLQGLIVFGGFEEGERHFVDSTLIPR